MSRTETINKDLEVFYNSRVDPLVILKLGEGVTLDLTSDTVEIYFTVKNSGKADEEPVLEKYFKTGGGSDQISIVSATSYQVHIAESDFSVFDPKGNYRYDTKVICVAQNIADIAVGDQFKILPTHTRKKASA